MVGVILFRAQPFHMGHMNMVEKAFQDCEQTHSELFIFVGSADKCGTLRNPLPIEFRTMLIEGALHEKFTTEQLKHIHIFPLSDLTDESDNSTHWGRYLYMKMFSRTKDSDMTIYYSDDPRIMLGWFEQDERWCLRFKFLDRYKGISATTVRHMLTGEPELFDELLENVLPSFVYNYREDIRKYLKEVL